ncbi:hypothetical protein ES288_A05G435100v1 [Gossypium darwinii]|uniref:Uncharacterized protein n=1 Tax=Gossypium darwinii TaxID=34276 RepID=A0A5D2GR72_GOSDA|nr:hypothetical protein ES288_A05G435100v1 [Gossypium darwinii]
MGETSDILLAEPVTAFFLSSRTSGGQPKLLPVTAEYQKKTSETDLFKVVTQAKILVKHWSAMQH